MMIDTHIHLSHFLYQGDFPYLSLEDGRFAVRRGTREQLIQALQAAGLAFCLVPAIDIESNRANLSLAERFPGFLFTAVGVHPTRTTHYAVVGKDGKKSVLKLAWKRRRELEECLNHPCVAAIGETGLDYHLPRREQHRLRQKLWFLYQLRLARRKKLPLVLHIRQADADALRILKRFGKGLSGGVCHCFLGSAELAGRYTALGFKLGIGGALLAEAPETQGLEQAVTAAALEDLVLETDGPYVKPNCPAIPKKQLRKARNTSLILPAVAARIAELKNVPLEEVYRVTSANAVKLFGQPGERE